MIPRIVHFVFGLEEQSDPFHFLHYVSIESCRRTLEPDEIYLHHKHLPFGPWWDRARPHLTLVETELAPEVLGADYSSDLVPKEYRYAHHADFVRLDALIEHGGIYADIDTLFVRPFPDAMFSERFVIGTEPPVRDEQSGGTRDSLCNALLMAERGSLYAREWRNRMAAALNGTWSNHSGFLAAALATELPSEVTVLPERCFFHFRSDRAGLAQLLEERHDVPPGALSVHLWAHLWWKRSRRDFSRANGQWCTPAGLRGARTTLADIARPYLPSTGRAVGSPARAPAAADTAGRETRPRTARAGRAASWTYLSLDETNGYATAADRCRAALEGSGVELSWTPFVRGSGYGQGLGYEPPAALDPFAAGRLAADHVVVAHLVPEFVPAVRSRCGDAFLVAHTAWETDRLPRHWPGCLRAADLVVVPSRSCADVMAGACVDPPVAVVPHPAPDLRPSTSRLWDDVSDDCFVFYTIAEWNERKAVFLTIEAYLRAFTKEDPVVLIVKTSRGDLRQQRADRAAGEGTSAFAVARMLAGHPGPPAIRLVTRELGDDDVRAVHERGDCFVSLSRGEGWGLGAFDAACYGNPVVATAVGGHLDYLSGTDYLVGFDLVPVSDPANAASYSPDQRWAAPHLDDAAELMRVVVRQREKAQSAARARACELVQQFSPERVAAAFREAVDAGLDRRRLPAPARRGARLS